GSSSSSRSPIRLRQRDSNNIPLQPTLQLPPATTTADNSNSGVNDGIDSALSNIPILPTIKTYKVTKHRPDEPAGLFLTKAKNGAVLVHSLSPESLFRKSTPLHPGQEVLSVNEKRVNDPKMAARLITQAKKVLSLRISTVERSRGFLYCQVKRRSGGSGGGGAGGTVPQDSSAATSTALVVSPGTTASATAGGGSGKAGTAATAGTSTALTTIPATPSNGLKRTSRGVGPHSPCHHGVRFVTTSVDGVRRSGTIHSTDGLVRVSHIDPLGLFANSHPMNRLRVGGIVLTVNGTPVTNGRMALEKVMGSRQLVEVLHCDERVWREDWVKDGLAQVLSTGGEGEGETKKEGNVSDNNDGVRGREEKNSGSDRSLPTTATTTDNNNGMWDLEWKAEREEVILRKKNGGNNDSSSSPPSDSCYAFKLIFNNNVGTCHPELVDETTMMPPADEFDVSLLVKMVNDSQRTMMTVLQNMLRKAKFELKFGSGAAALKRSQAASAASSAATATGGGDATSSYRPFAATSAASSSSRQGVDGSKDTRRQSTGVVSSINEQNEHQTSVTRNRERIKSCDGLMELVEGEHGGVDEELSQLAESLLRVDSRDRKRNTLRASHRIAQGKDGADVPNNTTSKISRRGSTGFSEAIAGLSPADIEQWRLEQWADQPDADANKIRNFSAIQQKMEQRYENLDHSRAVAKNAMGDSRSSLDVSMFSHDINLDDLFDYLEDCDSSSRDSDSSSEHGSVDDDDEEGHNDDSPPSPRNDDANKWEEGGSALRISPTQESGGDDDIESLPPEKKGDDEMAYITGVWRDVGSKYEISDKVVGSGGFGEVRDCYDKKTRQIYVVKTILKPSQDDTTKVNLIRNEILLLHEAHHPNIVELRDLFEDDKYVHIVMERCTGGDLFDRVVNENPRRIRSPAEAMKHESRTANSMRSILHVLKYLHSKGIVHRDIKPEHFLLTTEERETQKIKLIDFGLARKHKPGSALMTTFTGSPSFVAPEVIARRYDHMCDMFSVGVTAYFLLTGMLPFDGPTDEETFDLISAGKFKFPSSSVFLSDDAKDFITKLLKTNPNKRMNAGKALNHPWLLKAASC
ncbi:hypothetical protein ACHAXR_006565, partial [Thalassiosira sp. AJA248-18]